MPKLVEDTIMQTMSLGFIEFHFCILPRSNSWFRLRPINRPVAAGQAFALWRCPWRFSTFSFSYRPSLASFSSVRTPPVCASKVLTIYSSTSVITVRHYASLWGNRNDDGSVFQFPSFIDCLYFGSVNFYCNLRPKQCVGENYGKYPTKLCAYHTNLNFLRVN